MLLGMRDSYNFRELRGVVRGKYSDGERTIPRTSSAPMTDFIIGKTNFGIDTAASDFALLRNEGGQLVLSVEIRGDKKTYEKLVAGEDSEWSWTLRPPYLYLRDCPLGIHRSGERIAMDLEADILEDIDAAIYLMEHNDVSEVALELEERRIAISGIVDLMGKRQPFRIVWQK